MGLWRYRLTMSGFMVVSSLPDQKSLSKPVRIPPPWYRSKSIAGHGCGRHDDRFQRFVQGPNCFSDVFNQKTSLPVREHLKAKTEVHSDYGHGHRIGLRP